MPRLTTPAARRRVLQRLVALPLIAAGLPATAQPTRALKMGLIPFLSTRALVNVFDPLRQHLQQVLGAPVQSFTAVNHTAFAESLRNGDYDFAFMPAHTMRMAAEDWGYVPLARTSAPTRIVVAVRRDSPLRSIEQLRGTRIVLLDRLAITSMVALDELEDRGLLADRDIEVEYLVNISSVLLTLERPEVDAVALIEATLQDFPAAVRDRVRVLAPLRSVPSPGFAAHPRLAGAGAERLREALLSFAGARDGSGSISRSAFEPVTLADLDSLAPYAARLRRALADR